MKKRRKRRRGPRRLVRLVSKAAAALYLSCGVRTVDRLIATGKLTVVRLPVARASNGTPLGGETNRRVLLDLDQLDELIDACLLKETEQ